MGILSGAGLQELLINLKNILTGKVDKRVGDGYVSVEDKEVSMGVNSFGSVEVSEARNGVYVGGQEVCVSCGKIDMYCGSGLTVSGTTVTTNVGQVNLGGGTLNVSTGITHIGGGTLTFNTSDPAVHFSGHYLRDLADPARDNDAATKKYVDDKVAEAAMAKPVWASPVKTVADLNNIRLAAGDPKDRPWMCRVTDDTLGNSGVYQGFCTDPVAGTLEWFFYGDNLDFIDPEELGDALDQERRTSDNKYLDKTGVAADSAKLGGKLPNEFALLTDTYWPNIAYEPARGDIQVNCTTPQANHLKLKSVAGTYQLHCYSNLWGNDANTAFPCVYKNETDHPQFVVPLGAHDSYYLYGSNFKGGMSQVGLRFGKRSAGYTSGAAINVIYAKFLFNGQMSFDDFSSCVGKYQLRASTNLGRTSGEIEALILYPGEELGFDCGSISGGPQAIKNLDLFAEFDFTVTIKNFLEYTRVRPLAFNYEGV